MMRLASILALAVIPAISQAASESGDFDEVIEIFRNASGPLAVINVLADRCIESLGSETSLPEPCRQFKGAYEKAIPVLIPLMPYIREGVSELVTKINPEEAGLVYDVDEVFVEVGKKGLVIEQYEEYLED